MTTHGIGQEMVLHVSNRYLLLEAKAQSTTTTTGKRVACGDSDGPGPTFIPQSPITI